MNLLKELEPFNKDLDHWKDGHGITTKKTINSLITIWYNWQKEKTAEIWGNPNRKIVKDSPSCGSCLRQMMQMLYNWRAIIRKEETVKPKTQKMVTPTSKVNKSKPDPNQPAPKIVDYSKLKWGELLTMAKSKGINTHSKKKAQLIDELNALD